MIADAPNPLMEEALRLAALGWPVFALAPGTKLPRSGTRGLNDATTDEATIRKWWAQTPNANIAIAPPEGVLVIDTDPRNAEDMEPLAEMERVLEACPKAETRAGGAHMYVLAPRGVGVICGSDVLAPGIDIKTSGGYVLAPPSKVAPGGYAWLTALECAPGDLPGCPEALASKLKDAKSPADEARAVTREPSVPPDCDGRPGTDYNARGDVRALLEKHGWKHSRNEGDNEHWIRPGKESGTGATLKDGVLFVFTSNAGALKASTDKVEGGPNGIRGGYSPFQVYAALEHEGDYAAAARALAKQGYGSAGGGGADISGITEDDDEPTPEREPYPVHALPDGLRRYVDEVAEATNASPAMVAVALIPMLASAIGTKRRVRVKKSWAEPAVVWSAVVSAIGSKKTPVQQQVLRPLRRAQARAFEEYDAAKKEHEAALREHKAAVKATPKGEPEPEPPEAPTCTRYEVSDGTFEALAPILQENPAGVLLARDEGAAWVGELDRYAAKGGADAGRWLSIWSTDPIIIDRKSHDTIRIPRPAISLTLGFQAEILHRVMSGELSENGMLSRFLLAMPAEPPDVWTEADVSGEVTRAMEDTLRALTHLAHGEDEDGRRSPIDIELADDARAVFVGFYNELGRRKKEHTGALRGAVSKMTGQTLRIALTLHLAKWASGEGVERAIRAETMRAATEIARYHIGEAEAVFDMFETGEASADGLGDDERKALGILRRKGGSASVRELQQSARAFRDAEGNKRAKAALEGLEKAGLGRTEYIQTGGRESCVFTLDTGAAVTETPLTDSQAVDSRRNRVVTPENGASTPEPEDAEWESDGRGGGLI